MGAGQRGDEAETFGDASVPLGRKRVMGRAFHALATSGIKVNFSDLIDNLPRVTLGKWPRSSKKAAESHTCMFDV